MRVWGIVHAAAQSQSWMCVYTWMSGWNYIRRGISSRGRLVWAWFGAHVLFITQAHPSSACTCLHLHLHLHLHLPSPALAPAPAHPYTCTRSCACTLEIGLSLRRHYRLRPVWRCGQSCMLPEWYWVEEGSKRAWMHSHLVTCRWQRLTSLSPWRGLAEYWGHLDSCLTLRWCSGAPFVRSTVHASLVWQGAHWTNKRACHTYLQHSFCIVSTMPSSIKQGSVERHKYNCMPTNTTEMGEKQEASKTYQKAKPAKKHQQHAALQAQK